MGKGLTVFQKVLLLITHFCQYWHKILFWFFSKAIHGDLAVVYEVFCFLLPHFWFYKNLFLNLVLVIIPFRSSIFINGHWFPCNIFVLLRACLLRTLMQIPKNLWSVSEFKFSFESFEIIGLLYKFHMRMLYNFGILYVWAATFETYLYNHYSHLMGIWQACLNDTAAWKTLWKTCKYKIDAWLIFRMIFHAFVLYLYYSSDASWK